MTLGFLISLAWNTFKTLIMSKEVYILIGVFLALKMLKFKLKLKKGRFK